MQEKKIKKNFFLGAALLAAATAGCPDQVGEQCPSSTTSLGQFNLLFTGQHPSGECKAPGPDGGPIALVLNDGGVRSATFCYGTAPDGGGQIHLAVPQNGIRTSDLIDGGGFSYPAVSAGVTGTACDPIDGGSCPVTITESFTGILITSLDAGFALLPDGGLPTVASVTGTLVDSLTATNSTLCVCNIPCTVTYGISGTRF